MCSVISIPAPISFFEGLFEFFEQGASTSELRSRSVPAFYWLAAVELRVQCVWFLVKTTFSFSLGWSTAIIDSSSYISTYKCRRRWQSSEYLRDAMSRGATEADRSLTFLSGNISNKRLKIRKSSKHVWNGLAHNFNQQMITRFTGYLSSHSYTLRQGCQLLRTIRR